MQSWAGAPADVFAAMPGAPGRGVDPEGSGCSPKAAVSDRSAATQSAARAEVEERMRGIIAE
jgi:hypothetical protein